MLGTDQLLYVVVVIQHVLDRGGFVGLDELPHPRNSEYSAASLHRANGFIRLGARMASRKCPGVRMSDEHRLLRDLERLQRGLIAAVRHVDRHPDSVHPFDDRNAKIADAAVYALSAA